MFWVVFFIIITISLSTDLLREDWLEDKSWPPSLSKGGEGNRNRTERNSVPIGNCHTVVFSEFPMYVEEFYCVGVALATVNVCSLTVKPWLLWKPRQTISTCFSFLLLFWCLSTSHGATSLLLPFFPFLFVLQCWPSSSEKVKKEEAEKRNTPKYVRTHQQRQKKHPSF